MSWISSDYCGLDHYDRVLRYDRLVCDHHDSDQNGSSGSVDSVGSPEIVVIASLGKYQQLPLEQKLLVEQWVLLPVSPPKYCG